MKMLRVLLIAILISLVGYPAYSEEPLVLYDNFRGESINLNKWAPKSVSPEIVDVKRFVKWNRLHLMQRSFGGEASVFPDIATRIRLQFKNPLVTAIQAKLKVKHVEVVGCPVSNPAVPSVIRAGRLSGGFFKAINIDNNLTDVLAAIEIIDWSGSPNPDGELSVMGKVSHCLDPECFIVDKIGEVELGTITVGRWTQWTTLLIQWDRENDQFIFQRDNDPEQYVLYNLSGIEPTQSLKRIGVSAFLPTNCTAEERPVAYADVVIKNVFVNESALQPPLF